MHLFSKTKCIFKYKCMHVIARGYGTCSKIYGHDYFDLIVISTYFLNSFFYNFAKSTALFILYVY